MRHARNTVILLALVLALAACAQSQGTLLATGQTLDALGQQFVTLGGQLKAAKAAGQVSDQDYAKWVGFVPQFKIGFAQAEQAWQTAYKAGQKDAPQSTIDLITGLKDQLVTFLLMQSASATKGVKP